MNDEQLQKWVEHISLQSFGRPFLHRATFNSRLRTTGGRYFTRTHHIEISSRQLEVHGPDEVEKIIKHELCHYHLHLMNKGYRHRDRDFQMLLKQVGGSRYCKAVEERRPRESYKYKLQCLACGTEYLRRRRMDVRKYACGECRGRLQLIPLSEAVDEKGGR